MKIYHVSVDGRMKDGQETLKAIHRESFHLFRWTAKRAQRRMKAEARFGLEGFRLQYLTGCNDAAAFAATRAQDLRSEVESACLHERLSW